MRMHRTRRCRLAFKSEMVGAASVTLFGVNMQPFIPDLLQTLGLQGFRQLSAPDKTIPGAVALLKRQNVITNRAVVVLDLPEVPKQFGQYVATLRKQIAFRCGFFPFFYGVGIQLVLAAPDVIHSGLRPSDYVARIDNQWAIVQSVFLVDTGEHKFVTSRSWGQVVTGQFQDAIAEAIGRHNAHFQNTDNRHT